MPMKIRAATLQDLPFIVSLYNENIIYATSNFRHSPVTLAERKAWLEEKEKKKFPVLVVENEGILWGFASLEFFRFAEGYRYTLEHSIYVAKKHRRKGVATALVKGLICKAKELEVHSIVAGIDDSNQASHLLHQSLGFKKCGTLPEVGRKFQKWLDLTFYVLILSDR